MTRAAPPRGRNGVRALRVDSVVVDDQQPLALAAEPLEDARERLLFLCVGCDPAEPHADLVAHRVRRLRPHPPRRAIIRAPRSA